MFWLLISTAGTVSSCRLAAEVSTLTMKSKLNTGILLTFLDRTDGWGPHPECEVEDEDWHPPRVRIVVLCVHSVVEGGVEVIELVYLTGSDCLLFCVSSTDLVLARLGALPSSISWTTKYTEEEVI